MSLIDAAFLTQLPCAVLLVDGKGTVVEATQPVAGRSQRNVIGESLSALVHERHRPLLHKMLQHVMRRGVARRAVVLDRRSQRCMLLLSSYARDGQRLGVNVVVVNMAELVSYTSASEEEEPPVETGSRRVLPAAPARAAPQLAVVFEPDMKALGSRITRALEPLEWNVAQWPSSKLMANIKRIRANTRVLLLGRSRFMKVFEPQSRGDYAVHGVRWATRGTRAAIWLDLPEEEDQAERRVRYQRARSEIDRILSDAVTPERVAGIRRGDPRFGYLVAGRLLQLCSPPQEGMVLQHDVVEVVSMLGAAGFFQTDFVNFVGGDRPVNRGKA